jgi:hypothetical protein
MKTEQSLGYVRSTPPGKKFSLLCETKNGVQNAHNDITFSNEWYSVVNDGASLHAYRHTYGVGEITKGWPGSVALTSAHGIPPDM